MIGLILGAGSGSRLGTLTEDRPKLLLDVDGTRTIADVILSNFAEAGLKSAVIVGGYRIETLMDEVPRMEAAYGVDITVVANPYYQQRNNCFSLWLARHWFGQDILLSNGDTLHHSDIDRLLLADRSGAGIMLAVQTGLDLGEEEMKVAVDGHGRLTTITKGMDPGEGSGEYIGVARIRPAAGPALASALEAVISQDAGLYYEDAFQVYIDRGGNIALADIGTAPWTEVDTPADLDRARQLACLC